MWHLPLLFQAQREELSEFQTQSQKKIVLHMRTSQAPLPIVKMILKEDMVVNLHFNFKFQESFNEVPVTSVNESLWFNPMDYGQVAKFQKCMQESFGFSFLSFLQIVLAKLN